ncbi:hypothetical protein FBU30_009178 [Linnemannia zychae]|nr:hypothetical protein FBU30_009178 [Linnemannia zychae]
MSFKQDLRQANLRAWQQKPDPSALRNLDSNIKKNTAFIKKCKTGLTADVSTQLLNDIKKLSLEKYISEIVAAILEGLLRCKLSADVTAATEVISALHQRFPDTFTQLFTYHLAKALAPSPKLTHQQLAQAGTTPEQREKEESARISRQRVLSRVATELWLVGVLRNVEDGVATLGAEGSTGVSTKGSSTNKDTAVAALIGSSKDTKGAHADGKAMPNFIYTILHDLLAGDKEHVNLPIVLTVLKIHGRDLTGIVPRKAKTASDGKDSELKATATEDANSGQPDTYVSSAQQQLFKTLFLEYYKGLETHLIRDHKDLKKVERKNEASLFSRGELSEERQQQYEKQFKAFEKLSTSTQTIADALDVEFPVLKDEKEDLIGIVESSGSTEEKGTTSSVFEDEDNVVFYEQILDLRTLVPKIFLETSKSKKDKKDEGTEPEKEGEKSTKEGASTTANVSDADNLSKNSADHMDDFDESTDLLMESIDAELGNMELNDQTGTDSFLAEETMITDISTAASKTNATQIDAFMARLPNMCNRDMIDQAAVEFCYLNSKLSRNRLIKTLVQVPRDRHDLLPYYSRMIATFQPFYPDIAEEVLNALEREFRGLLRKKHMDLSESRVKNIKFLSELVKFGLTPLPIIFYCLKVLLEDFIPQNIIVACALLETCGRFLKLKSTATATRLDALLEILKRKKTAIHLEPRFLLMIDNAYYQCNPPEQSTRQKREVPPIEQFIRKLLYLDLCKKNVETTHKLLRKLDWNNPEIYNLVIRLFSKVWKIKFSNIHLMAILVNGLSRYHSDFSIAIVDSVVESIRIGLEQNNFRHNQKRIAIVKFLGELYNYRMVDSPLIFSTLDTLLSVGHEHGRASPDHPSPIDAPHDCFRIRLVCTLLDTCGMCFDHGSSKIKLDSFLVLFQMYILSKESIPLEIEYMIEDTFSELRPKLRRFQTYEEAQAAVEALHGPLGGNDPNANLQNDDSDSEDSEGDDDGDDDQQDDDDDESEDDEDGLEDEEEVHAMRQMDDEEQAVVLTNQLKPVEAVDEDFEREYLKMMTESLESRKFERKHLTLDVAIPVLRSADRREEPILSNPDHVAFTLLTKKGNKQQLKTVGLPSDSALVINTRNQREAEREEQQQLKQLVLDYEVREEANQRAALEQSMRNQGIRLNIVEDNRRGNPGNTGYRESNQSINQNRGDRGSYGYGSDPRSNTRWARNQTVGVGAGFGTESALTNLGVDGYERRPVGGQSGRGRNVSGRR